MLIVNKKIEKPNEKHECFLARKKTSWISFYLQNKKLGEIWSRTFTNKHPYLQQLGIYSFILVFNFINFIFFDFQISAPPFRQMASLQTGPWSIPSRLGDDLGSTSVRIGARPASYVAGSFFSPVSGAYAGKINNMTFKF